MVAPYATTLFSFAYYIYNCPQATPTTWRVWHLFELYTKYSRELHEVAKPLQTSYLQLIYSDLDKTSAIMIWLQISLSKNRKTTILF